MKEESISITNNPSAIPPLNSAEVFRAELAKINAQEVSTEEDNSISDIVSKSDDNQELETGNNKELQAQPEIANDEDNEEENSATIPRKRLNKEIEKRKSIETQLQIEREEKIRAQAELDLINQAIAKLNNGQSNSNEPNETIEPLDPESHQFFMKKIQELEQKLENTATKINQTEQQRSFAQTYGAQRAEFSKKNSDFNDAYQYLENTEINKLQYMYPKVTHKQAQDAVREAFYQMGELAINEGRSIPEMFYNIAKGYGYNKTNASDKPSPNLDAINNNMRKSKSISDIPAAALSPSNGASNYTTLKNFNKLSRADGRGVDPDLFHGVLDSLRKGK